MSTKTPEQRAQERYPGEETMLISIDGEREGYAVAIREEVEPRDRLLQEAVDALADPHKVSLGTAALAKAKEQFGITPKP